MSDLQLYIVGSGTMGRSLGGALGETDRAEVVGAWNRSQPNADLAKEVLHVDVTVSDEPTDARIAKANLILLCVNDDAIESLAKSLKDSGHVSDDAVVAHVSGCLPARVMGNIGKASIGSIHPLVACPKGSSDITLLRGARFVIEGHPQALDTLKTVVELLDGKWSTVRPELKGQYHAAATMAANLQVAMLAEAIRLAERAGLSDAREAMSDLALGAVAKVKELGPVDALSGPVTRGDVATIKKHMSSLPDDVAQLYRIASLGTLGLARKQGLNKEAWHAIRKALSFQ